MADRKISELSEAQSVASGDVMVVVTGVDVDGATLTTNKFPLSGLVNHIVNIDELTFAGTGIYLEKDLNIDSPNLVTINVSGYSYLGHTHTASEVTDFSSAVSGEVQQIVKFQSSDLAATGQMWAESADLTVSLAANSKYLLELGTILVNNENNTKVSGFVEITGTQRVNNPTQIYGTWNFLDTNSNSQSVITNTNVPFTGYGLLVDSLDPSLNSDHLSLVNHFMVETTNNEADTLTFHLATDSTNQSTSGVLKKGSWIKAEKVI